MNGSFAALAHNDLTAIIVHFLEDGKLRWVERLLSDLEFLQIRCEAGQVRALLGDYQRTEKFPIAAEIVQTQAWREWKQFVTSQAHHFDRDTQAYPQLIFQQAYNYARQGRVPAAAHRLLRLGNAPRLPWVERINRSDLAKRPALLETLEGHEGLVRSIAITADDRFLVSGSQDKTLRVWDLATGQCCKTLRGHTEEVDRVAVTTDGKILSTSPDGSMRIWDLETGACLHTLAIAGRSYYRTPLVPTSEGLVVSWSEDNTLGVWDTAHGTRLTSLVGHTREIRGVALFGDGHAVSAANDETAMLWDLRSGQCLSTLRLGLKPTYIIARGRIVVCAERLGTLHFWDPADGKALVVHKGHTSDINWMAFADASTVITASDDRTLKLWDVTTGKCLRVFEGHTERVQQVHVTADRRAVSLSDMDESIRIWSLSTGDCLASYSTRAPADLLVTRSGIAFCAVGLAWIQAWDLAPECYPLEIPRHAGGGIRLVKTSDARLVTGGYDGSVLVWKLPMCQFLRKLEGHRSPIAHLLLTDEGILISLSRDGTIAIFDLHTYGLLGEGYCPETPIDRVIRSDDDYLILTSSHHRHFVCRFPDCTYVGELTEAGGKRLGYLPKQDHGPVTEANGFRLREPDGSGQSNGIEYTEAIVLTHNLVAPGAPFSDVLYPGLFELPPKTIEHGLACVFDESGYLHVLRLRFPIGTGDVDERSLVEAAPLESSGVLRDIAVDHLDRLPKSQVRVDQHLAEFFKNKDEHARGCDVGDIVGDEERQAAESSDRRLAWYIHFWCAPGNRVDGFVDEGDFIGTSPYGGPERQSGPFATKTIALRAFEKLQWEGYRRSTELSRS